MQFGIVVCGFNVYWLARERAHSKKTNTNSNIVPSKGNFHCVKVCNRRRHCDSFSFIAHYNLRPKGSLVNMLCMFKFQVFEQHYKWFICESEITAEAIIAQRQRKAWCSFFHLIENLKKKTAVYTYASIWSFHRLPNYLPYLSLNQVHVFARLFILSFRLHSNVFHSNKNIEYSITKHILMFVLFCDIQVNIWLSFF